MAALPAFATDGRPQRRSPLLEADAQAALGIALTVDAEALTQVTADRAVRLTDFTLPTGELVALDLEQFDVFAPHARLVVVDDAGEHELPRPDLTLFRGSIAGEPDSSVLLGFGPDATVNGRIVRDGREMIVSSGPSGSGVTPLIYEMDAQAAAVLNLADWSCSSDLLPPLPAAAAPAGEVDVRDNPCRIADIAVETDFQYRQLFGSNGAATSYTGLLMGAVSEVFARDTGLRMRVTFLRLWNTSADPWNQSDTGSQLVQFRDYWNANMDAEQRHIATFLSGRGLGGGVAWLAAACFPDYDYSLNANLGGSFPYPIQNNSAQNWDLMVTTHELGHNFGAPHTHDMTPPVDGCAFGDCSVAPNGTIMSYCHGCANGLADVRMEFHPRSINEAILPFLASGQCAYGQNPGALPLAGATLCSGVDHTLNLSAFGGGTLTYQWRRNTENIVGATAASYQINDADAGDAGSYDCIVTNECGSTISSSAVIDVCENAIDTNADCNTDLDDLLIVLGNFGTPSGAGQADGNLDGDGDVDLDDLLLVLGNFGAGC